MHRLILKFAVPIILILACAIAGVGIYGYVRFNEPSKPTHRLSLEKIERMGKLELVRITIKDVLQQTKERPFGLPDAKALLVVVGQASIGIDLQKMTKDDFSYTDAQITVRLPKPETMMAKVDHKESKVYDVQWGFTEATALQEEAWKSAEEAIRLVAADGRYYELCKTNALLLLTPIFQELAGEKKVVITFRNT